MRLFAIAMFTVGLVSAQWAMADGNGQNNGNLSCPAASQRLESGRQIQSEAKPVSAEKKREASSASGNGSTDKRE